VPSEYVYVCVYLLHFFGVLEMCFSKKNENIGTTAESFRSLLPFLVLLYFCWVSYLAYLNLLGKDFDDDDVVVVLIQLVFFCL
jgi:hypothetical protein